MKSSTLEILKIPAAGTLVLRISRSMLNLNLLLICRLMSFRYPTLKYPVDHGFKGSVKIWKGIIVFIDRQIISARSGY